MKRGANTKNNAGKKKKKAGAGIPAPLNPVDIDVQEEQQPINNIGQQQQVCQLYRAFIYRGTY